MISIENLNFEYKSGFFLNKHKILDGITIQIKKGSVCALLGSNGIGKTTLIHCLVGIKRPQSGIIKIDGLDSFSKKAKEKIGFLPERPYLYEYLTGREFLSFISDLYLFSDQRKKERIQYTLRLTDMESAADKKIKNYSKGMLQRIGIAQAILNDPEYVICDEPYSGLDVKGQNLLVQIFKSLNEKGKTIFFTTHTPTGIEKLSPRLLQIEDKKIKEINYEDIFSTH